MSLITMFWIAASQHRPSGPEPLLAMTSGTEHVARNRQVVEAQKRPRAEGFKPSSTKSRGIMYAKTAVFYISLLKEILTCM